MAIRNSILLERLNRGLLVISEKALGKIEVSKLRVILLLKADFNTMYKIIFSERLMSMLERRKYILFEIIGGRRNQVVIYIALNKNLLLMNQTRRRHS